MFQRLQALSRSNQGGERERTPDYLQTHPVTTTRISEAKQRAEQLAKDSLTLITTTPGGQRTERVSKNAFALPGNAGSDNPLLPGSLRLPDTGPAQGGSGQFSWARERLRALSADTPDAAIREYERIRRAGKFNDAQRYGLALARLQDGQGAAAAAELAPLLEADPGE